MKHDNCIINDEGLVEYYKDYRIPNKKELIQKSHKNIYNEMFYEFVPGRRTYINMLLEEALESSELEINKHLLHIVKSNDPYRNSDWGGF